ncbi:hypothetical protein ACFQ0G_48370 [Streptomyces chiangmaiensis]
MQQPGVDGTGFGLKFLEVVQAAQDSEVLRGVDDGLDAQCPAF